MTAMWHFDVLRIITCAVFGGAAIAAASPYPPKTLDANGYVGVRHFVDLPPPFKAIRAEFDRSPSVAGYDRLWVAVGPHWGSVGQGKVLYDCAMKLGTVPALMRKCKDMALSRQSSLLDRLVYAYLRRVAASGGWKPGPVEDLTTRDLRTLKAEIPRSDLEAQFALSQVAEDIELADHRAILLGILTKAPRDHRVRLVLAISYLKGYRGSFIIRDNKIVGTRPSDAPPDKQAALKHCKIIIAQEPDFAPAYYFAARSSKGKERDEYLQGYITHEKDKSCRTYKWATEKLAKSNGER